MTIQYAGSQPIGDDALDRPPDDWKRFEMRTSHGTLDDVEVLLRADVVASMLVAGPEGQVPAVGSWVDRPQNLHQSKLIEGTKIIRHSRLIT